MPRQNQQMPKANKGDPVPQLALSHGQVIWLLTELGLRGGVSKSTFNHYVKSLRRLGIPFGRRKGESQRGPAATYNFEDLMELTVALLLRVYGTLPDVVTNGLRSFPRDLRPIYRKAYLRFAEKDLSPGPRFVATGAAPHSPRLVPRLEHPLLGWTGNSIRAAKGLIAVRGNKRFFPIRNRGSIISAVEYHRGSSNDCGANAGRAHDSARCLRSSGRVGAKRP